MDCWVFQLEPCEPHELGRRIQVSHLQRKTFGWSLIHQDAWDEVRGSSDFLLSVALPETRIVLGCTPKSGYEGYFVQQVTVWIGQESGTMAEYESWHRFIEHEMQLIGKKAEAALFDVIEQAPEATTLVKTSPEEATYVQQLLKQPYPIHPFWACLGLALRIKRRTRRLLVGASAACLTLCLVLWHALPDWYLTQQASQTQLLTKKFQHSANQTWSPNWAATFDKLKKFGANNRANLHAVTLLWNESGEVQPRVLLAKTRKRLPKGCQSIHGQWVKCPVIAPSMPLPVPIAAHNYAQP